MMDFYRTRAGKQFFEHDLGNLISAIKELSNSINESNKLTEKKLLFEKKMRLEEKSNVEKDDDNKN